MLEINMSLKNRDLVCMEPHLFFTIGEENNSVPYALPITLEEFSNGTFTEESVEASVNIVNDAVKTWLLSKMKEGKE